MAYTKRFWRAHFGANVRGCSRQKNPAKGSLAHSFLREETTALSAHSFFPALPAPPTPRISAQKIIALRADKLSRADQPWLLCTHRSYILLKRLSKRVLDDIPLQYQSLHEVEIIGTNDQLAAFRLECLSTITSDKIKEIRELFRCDCKAFWSTGWACSHVIASASVLKTFNLENAVTELPITRVSGGQRKIPGALYRDDPANKTLSKTNLMSMLLKKPFYPLNMFVAADFSDTEDGVEMVSYLTGRIGKPEQVNGVYNWKVTYEDGTVEAYGCEDLVDIIVASRHLGIDVTCHEPPALDALIAARDAPL